MDFEKLKIDSSIKKYGSLSKKIKINPLSIEFKIIQTTGDVDE
jgi:hypothetical protein